MLSLPFGGFSFFSDRQAETTFLKTPFRFSSHAEGNSLFSSQNSKYFLLSRFVTFFF